MAKTPTCLVRCQRLSWRCASRYRRIMVNNRRDRSRQHLPKRLLRHAARRKTRANPSHPGSRNRLQRVRPLLSFSRCVSELSVSQPHDGAGMATKHRLRPRLGARLLRQSPGDRNQPCRSATKDSRGPPRKSPNPVFAKDFKNLFAAGFPRKQKAQGATWAIMNSIYSLLWNVKHPVRKPSGER